MAFDDPSAAPDNAMPCASGQLIGTVALMTADASTGPEAGMQGMDATQEEPGFRRGATKHAPRRHQP